MHYLEKSPGMCSDRPGTCSDRPGTTPKGLDLVAFPTCLREKERDTFGVSVRFGAGGEGDTSYKSSLADPTFLSIRGLSAISRRTVRLWIFTLQPDWHCFCWILHSLWRTVRGTLADRPQCFSAVENFSAEPLVNKSHEWRTVRPLPADRPRYQKSDKSEFCQFSQFQLQFGIIAHIKIQKSQILHENLQKTHMSKLQQEFKK